MESLTIQVKACGKNIHVPSVSQRTSTSFLIHLRPALRNFPILPSNQNTHENSGEFPENYYVSMTQNDYVTVT